MMGERLIISGRVPGTREKMIVLKDDVKKKVSWEILIKECDL
jgi:ribosomal protein L3